MENPISQDMLTLATEALAHAYCPYSHYPVAACVRAEDGTLFTATNVENAAYNLCSCAETNAITQLASCGYRHIEECVVLVKGEKPASPCGACRQRLAEFSNEKTVVHMCCTSGKIQTKLLSELLPWSFGPKDLENTQP